METVSIKVVGYMDPVTNKEYPWDHKWGESEYDYRPNPLKLTFYDTDASVHIAPLIEADMKKFEGYRALTDEERQSLGDIDTTYTVFDDKASAFVDVKVGITPENIRFTQTIIKRLGSGV